MTNLLIVPGNELSVELAETKFRTILVGMETDKYLIIRTPMNPDLGNLFAKGDSLIIRYIYLGNVYGFRSTILDVFLKPFPILFLVYPKTIENLNLRKGARIHCSIPGSAYLHDEKLDGVIMDISTGGVRFVVKLDGEQNGNSIEVGEQLLLEFPLYGLDGVRKCQGTVRSLSKDGKKLDLGLQFQDLDPAVAEKIEAYVEIVNGYLEEDR